MKINFETIRAGFLEYLESKIEKNEFKEQSDSSEISIFEYSDEFREYVSDELNLDLKSLPLSLSDVMEMEIVDGTFHEASQENIDSQLDMEDNAENVQNDENPMIGILNDLLKDEDVITALDFEKDGVLSEDEILSFVQTINTNDEDEENLSLEDVLLGIEQIKKGEYKANDKKNVEEVDEAQSVSNSPASINGANYQNSGLNPQNQQNTDNLSYEQMSLEQLESIRGQKQDEIDNATKVLNDAQSGNTQAIQKAQQDCDSKKEAYEKALENDSQISDELKQNGVTINNDISTKESEVSSLEVNINNVSNQILNKESEINLLNTNLSALQASLMTLSSQTSEKTEKQQEIDAQKIQVESEIASITAELETAQDELNKLNEEKTGYENDKNTKEAELASLKEQKASIDSEIEANATPETKALLQECNSAKANVDKIKSEEIQKAQEVLNNAKIEFAKIEQEFNVKTAQKVIADNKVSTGDLFDNNIEYDIQYVNDGKTMPYLLIGPKNANPNEPLPALVYLHGSGEVGGGADALTNVGPGKIIPQWGLDNFNGYIICPHLTGSYNSGNWRNDQAVNDVQNLMNNFTSTHNVDMDKIAIAGHSLGGQGAIYIAGKTGNYYKSVGVLSGYGSSVNISDVKAPVYGYVGSANSGEDKNSVNAMNNMFGSRLVTLNASHASVPYEVFNMDLNNDGHSDFFELLFGDK